MTCENFLVDRKGLRLRGSWLTVFTLSDGFLFSDELAEDVVTLETGSLASKTLLVTNRWLYEITAEALVPLAFQEETLVASFGTTPFQTVTFSGFDPLAQGITTNDYLLIDYSTSSEAIKINTVSENVVTLETAPSFDPSTATVKLIRPFQSNPLLGQFCSFDTWNHVLYLTDSYKVFSSDGTTVDEHSFEDENGDPVTIVCRVLSVFQERIWFANSADYPIRVWWTEVSEANKVYSTSWMDLPSAVSEVLALLSLGSLLIAYLRNGIFYGQTSNMTDVPLVFTKLEVGRTGISSQKGAVTATEGHFFVAEDAVWFLGSDLALKTISDNVRNALLLDSGLEVNRTVLAMDRTRDRLVVGLVLSAGGFISTLWSYNYKLNAWFTEAIPSGSFLTNSNVYDETSWSEVEGTWEAQTRTWTGFSAAAAGGEVLGRWIEPGVFQTYDSTNSSLSSANFDAVFEITDLDFNDPDNEKTAYRLWTKIEKNVLDEVDVSIVVEGSVDSGSSWKALGTMTIVDRESFVDFRLTGTTLRFRLTTPERTYPFTIVELSLRVLGRGLQETRE